MTEAQSVLCSPAWKEEKSRERQAIIGDVKRLRHFLAGLAVVFFLVVGLISYGAYLNYRSANQITERMSEQRVPLLGEAAAYRELKPKIALSSVRLASNELTDATALVSGKITEVLVKKNDHVRAGQVLMVLSMPEIGTKIKQADSAILKAEAELAEARNNYDRYERLKAKDATSATQYDHAKASYHSAESALSTAIAQKEELLIQMDQQEVRAPVDGEVLLVYLPQGAYVSPGTSLVLVGNFNRLTFSLPVDELMARHLYVGREALLSFSDESFDKIYDTRYAPGNLGDKQEFTAHVVEIMPDISEPAAMRRVVWEVDNSSSLLEQKTYTDVSIASVTPRRCLTVPLSAMTDSSHNAVFVFKPDGTLERREVETGLNDEQYVEILSGLQEGENVVISDVRGLTDGMKVTLMPAREGGTAGGQ